MRPLLDELEIEGKVITADALLTQKAISEYLVTEREADFVFTVKENQPTLKRDMEALALRAHRCDTETIEKGHGRLEICRIWCDDSLNAYGTFPNVQQVFCIEREVTHRKQGLTTVETVYGVTSQSPEKASPKKILSQNRNHWSVENTPHYVLDVTFDAVRSQIRRLNGSMVMTCLRRSAISLLRMKGHTNIAQTCRRLWAKPHLAIRMALPRKREQKNSWNHLLIKRMKWPCLSRSKEQPWSGGHNRQLLYRLHTVSGGHCPSYKT